MAEDTTIGLKIVAETDSFEMAMKKTKENIKQLGANFKESVASLDRWSQSSDGLSKKLDGLNGELGQYKTQIEATKKKIAELSKNEEANSVAIEKKKKELQDANTKYKATQQSILYYSEELAKVKKREDEAKSASGQLASKISEQKSKVEELKRAYKDSVLTYGENSRESKNLAKQLKVASKELDNTEKEAKQAEDALNRLGGSVAGTSKHIGSLEAVGKRTSSVLKKVGLGATGLITGFLATASSTRELRTNMGKLDTAFETNGLSAKNAQKTYKDLYSVLGDSDQATETANLIAGMVDNEKDLSKWTEISTGVFATFGDSLPVESLAEASMETAKTGEIVGGLADALNWAGIDQENFQKKLDNCTNEQERQKLITETLTKTYGSASKQYKETNKDVIASNKAQADLSAQMAEVGKIAEPMMTSLKEMGAGLLETIVPFAEKYMPMIQANLPAIAGGVALLVGGFAGLAVATTVAKVAIDAYTVGVKAWSAVTKIATVTQKALNLVMKANPIGLVITAIGLLVVAFIALWKKSEAFRNFWKGLWDGIKKIVSKVVTAISGFFSGAWDKSKKAWSTAKSFFTNLVQKIVEAFKNQIAKVKGFFSGAWEGAKTAWSTAKSWFSNIIQKIVEAFKNFPSNIKNFFSKAWDNAKSAWSNVKSYFSGKLTDITGAFKSLPDKMKKIGTDMIEGMWNGIKDMTSWITGKLKGFSGDVLGGIKDFFGIESPSKVMRDEVGKNLVAGMAEGVEDSEGGFLSTAGDFVSNIIDFFTSAFQDESIGGGIGNLFAGLGEKGKAFLESIAKKLGLDFGKAFNESVADSVDVGEDIAESIEKPSVWQRIKSALDKLDKYFKNWQKGIGKYIDQIAGYFDTVTSKASELGTAILNYNGQIAENRQNKIDQEISELKEGNDKKLEEYQRMKDEELVIAQNQNTAELSALETQYTSGLISATDYYVQRKALEDSYATFVKDNENAVASYTREQNDLVAKQEEELLRKKNEIAKRQFEAQRLNDIAQATIQGALAIMKGFAQLGPIGGAINAGIQAGITATQIATIASQKYVPMLAKGGIANSATLAMIGENGKEAVLPLERNTGWIDELAEKLNAVMRKDLLGGLSLQPAYAGMASGNVSNVNNFTQVINAPKTPSRRELYRDSKNLLALRGI